ncbi:hypothetical protein ElyMa_006822900, partial [Elysia marginata]
MACLRTPTIQCREQEKKQCRGQPFCYQMQHPPWFHCPPKCPVFRKPLQRRAEYDYELT